MTNTPTVKAWENRVFERVLTDYELRIHALLWTMSFPLLPKVHFFLFFVAIFSCMERIPLTLLQQQPALSLATHYIFKTAAGSLICYLIIFKLWFRYAHYTQAYCAPFYFRYQLVTSRCPTSLPIRNAKSSIMSSVVLEDMPSWPLWFSAS